MRSWIACILILVVACTSISGSNEPLRILFIGNSYTFVNQLPETFAEMAALGGHVVVVESLAKGGYSLADHLSDEETGSLFDSQTWDIIILQEKSSFPVSKSKRENVMFPAIREFKELATVLDSDTILFMPWAYRDGFPEPGLDEYSLMQEEIENAYLEIGSELGLSVAPVGNVWKEVLEQEPQLMLWNPDGSHPSPAGSFLAANVFYSEIFNRSPAEIAFTPAGVSEEKARLIAEIVGETLTDKIFP